MSSVPPFSKRAATQINRLLSSARKDLQVDKYLPTIGWEVGFDESFVPGPALGLHEKKLIPEDLQIECHGVTLAYNLPPHIMDQINSHILDFDGNRFIFRKL
jgi:hypothetical protein